MRRVYLIAVTLASCAVPVLASPFQNVNPADGFPVGEVAYVSAAQGADYRYIRRSGGGRLTTQETPKSIPYEDAESVDYDVSKDGKRWFHLIGKRCVSKLQKLVVK